jgi:hypothetical protein
VRLQWAQKRSFGQRTGHERSDASIPSLRQELIRSSEHRNEQEAGRRCILSNVERGAVRLVVETPSAGGVQEPEVADAAHTNVVNEDAWYHKAAGNQALRGGISLPQLHKQQETVP